MNTWKLRFSMAATLAVIFGLTTLGFTVILTLFGYGISIWAIGVLVVLLNIVQWLVSPYLVGAIYRVKGVSESENPKLHQMIASLSQKSGIKKPQVMLSQMPFPNAFAYGSPLTGSRVAVTQGLLNSLNDGEVEAVVGHELGHLKHRDVQVMMIVSFLPALFYYIGYSLMWSGILGGGDRNRNNDNGSIAVVGIIFMAFSWILTLFTLYLSRLREYYADKHSASIVENGAEKLSLGLVTIVEESKRGSNRKKEAKTNSSYKALFIADPDRANVDAEEIHNAGYSADKRQLLRDTLAKNPSGFDKFLEIFSTHPNMIKRLRALQELQEHPSNY